MKCKQKEESGRRERRGRRERGRRGGDGLLWCSGRQESATKKSLRFQAFKVNKREYKYGGGWWTSTSIGGSSSTKGKRVTYMSLREGQGSRRSLGRNFSCVDWNMILISPNDIRCPPQCWVRERHRSEPSYLYWTISFRTQVELLACDYKYDDGTIVSRTRASR